MPGSTTKLCIRVKNNINQIPELERVELTEIWTEEEKIPIKTSGGTKPAAAPKQEEAKKEAAETGATGGEGEAAANAEGAAAEEAKAPETPPAEE